MTRSTFFKHFELLADQPDAVAKLRTLIFELAAEGMLLGPASKPVEKTHLGEFAEFVMGQAPAGNECNTNGEGTIFVKAGEFGPLYAEVKCWTTRPLKFAKRGDVLICVVGATVGKLNLAIDSAIGRSVAAIRPSKALRTKFLYYSLMPFVLRLRNSSRGSAQGVIGKDDLGKIRIWIPTTEVQDKVVAKVDGLMSLCDELEQRQQARQHARGQLQQSALHHLQAAREPSTFAGAWQRVRDHFHLLHDTPDAIPQLRQAIITLAIQGKVVPQDSKEEAGERILERIKRAKAAQPSNGKADELESIPAVEGSEAPFALPASWTWARLGEVARIKHGFAFKSELFTDEPTPFVLTTPGNFYEKGGFRDRGAKTKYYRGKVPAEFVLRPGDLIIPMTEQAPGLLGSPAFIPKDGKTYLHNQRLGKLGFYADLIAPEFASIFFNSAFFRGELGKTCTGMKVRHTSPRKVLRVPFPICSLAEQKRIVARVEELLRWCDTLEAQLRQTRTLGAHLLASTLHHLLAV
jgi:type I restriction enzyme S subunit